MFVCSHVVILGLSVRLSWYTMWWCGDCRVCAVFVLDVSMLRGCEGDGNACVGDGEGVVVLSAGNVGRTRGSSIVSSAADVLGMRGVGVVC